MPSTRSSPALSADEVLVFDEATVASLRDGSQAPSQTQQHQPTDDEQRKLQIRGLQKWGIPIGASSNPPEIVLLARVVWVKYKRQRHDPYLWPAIYYKTYREIAHHAPVVWSELGFVRRLPLAMTMVFDSSNPKNKTPVARLLGKADIELIEIPKNSQSEFYRELPTLLPEIVCNIDYFAQDPGLYFDWHRALDEVEMILRECLGNRYALSTEPSFITWHERAQDAELRRWKAAMKDKGLLSTCACNYACGDDFENEDDLDNSEVVKPLADVKVY